MVTPPLPAPMTRVQLDEKKCDTPGCDCGGRIVLLAPCHPNYGLAVEYDAGVVTVKCHVCDHTLARILVASASPAEVH